VIELREWSRMVEDLQQERDRLFSGEPQVVLGLVSSIWTTHLKNQLKNRILLNSYSTRSGKPSRLPPRSEAMTDIFVHASALDHAGLAGLTEGQPVAVDVIDGEEGSRCGRFTPDLKRQNSGSRYPR
jgi:cold shock CspA family protein